MGEKAKSNVPAPNSDKLRQVSTLLTRKAHAVCVRHAYKYYGSKNLPNHVLVDLKMTVAQGSIYGLLGASGCGKTTLLSSIVARKKLDSGEIWVLGGKPGTKGSAVPGKRIGYMPQEIALYEEFTIKETAVYFGWIFGMPTSEINERLQFFLDFLELPTKHRLVKNLSGGQQRRVSFAMALVHDPELLILDEPTVGVDPVLRHRIWDYLVEITKEGNKTVILTTHYIEEAIRAQRIGLMRNGKLLAEDSPETLLRTYGSKSLEDVFLLLSRQQGAEVGAKLNKTIGGNKDAVTDDEMNLDMGKEPNFCMKMFQDCTDCSNITSIGKMKALVQKNTLRMLRNVGVMLFIFAMPVIQTSLFCLTIGHKPTELKLAIVNKEKNYINSSYQQCDVSPGCAFSNLSCRYLHFLNTEDIEKVYYPDTNSAIAAVKNGEAWGTMYFTENFTAALTKRMALGKAADPDTLKQSEIRIWLDMSNQQIGLMLAQQLQVSYQKFAKEMLVSCKQNPEQAETPISLQKPIYGSHSPSFTDFVAPGVILTCVFFLAVASTTSALISERTEGLLDRSYVAGVTPCEVLFSHIVTQFLVMCGQAALVLIFTLVVFDVRCEGAIGWVILLTVLQGQCGMCYGIAISAICSVERNATQLALGTFYPILLLSGVIWPIEGMSAGLRYLALLLPLTMATTSLRSMLSRGWSLFDNDVYYGFVSTIVWIVIFLTVSLVVLRFSKG